MVEIRISDLTHEFDEREVFRSLDMTCNGPCLAITGPNGSGKSTLLRIMAGLVTPSSGQVCVRADGSAVSSDKLREIVGLAAPDVRLYQDLSARENLRFLLRARGSKLGEDRIAEVLEQVELTDRADDVLGELSSGLRQRAALAAALVHMPRLLLLDEPSSNLDEAGVRMVRSVVEAQAHSGMVVIATNDFEEAKLGVERLDLGATR